MGKSEAPSRLSPVIDATPLASTVGLVGDAPPPVAPTPRAAPTAPASTPPVGQPVPSNKSVVYDGAASRLGRYILLRKLGEGGMGVVFAAYDEDLDRKVAVKLLHPAHRADSDLRLRIVREAQALARVSAPNVVHVYEVGEINEQMFIAMEFVNGTTLTQWQAAQPRTWQETLRMYAAAGLGLLAAHQSGLTHRDFKPDNVLVGSDGRPRVADFGVARMGGAAAIGPIVTRDLIDDDELDLASTTARLPGLTQEGASVGTPLYMSPEQHLGEPVDGRSDQFSFCVALYEALYGQLPFVSKNLISLRYNVVKGNVLPRPPKSKVPAPVHAALLRGLSTTPDQRFPSMRELLSALSFDEAHDPAAAPGERRMVTVGLLSFAAFSAFAQRALKWLGVEPQMASLDVALILFACMSFLTFRFRKMLLTNAFHRGIILTSLTLSGAVSGLRLVGLILKMPMSQVLTHDMVALTAMTFMLSAMGLPLLWPLSILCGGLTLVAAFNQPYATLIGQSMFPVMIFAAVILWNRGAQQRVSQDSGRSS